MTNNSVVVQLAGPENEDVSTLDVVQLTPTSPLLGEWHAVMRAAYTEGQGVMWWESLAHLRYSVTHPHSRSTRFMFAAMRGGQCVGALEIAMRVDHPTEPVQIELGVAPESQGEGVGQKLAAHARRFTRERGCTTLQAEIFASGGQPLESARSGRFLTRAGFAVGNVEDRFLLDLPWDGRGERAPSCLGLVLSSWVGACPIEHEVAWSALEQQMEEDVPLGDLTRGDTLVDVARMREKEQRMADRGWLVLHTMALLDRRPCGYTELMVDPDEPTLVVQESTLVDRAGRRRGVGRALKTANLRQLSQMSPDLVSQMKLIQTYTAQHNAPMQRLNEQFGFRKVGTMYDAELRIADTH